MTENDLILPAWIEEQISRGQEFRRMVEPLQTRNASDEGTDWDVEGYATTFDQFYTLYSHDGLTVNERIDANAFDGCDMSDFIMQYDHHGRVFARNRNDTLTGEPDEHGLHIRARLRGTELGRQILEEIRGGYSDQMSFRFAVADGGDRRELIEDGQTGQLVLNRTILKIAKLYDVSVVSIPANGATEIFARGMADGAISWAAQEVRAFEARRKAQQRLRLKLKLMEV